MRADKPNGPPVVIHYTVLEGAAERRAAWVASEQDYAAVMRRQFPPVTTDPLNKSYLARLRARRAAKVEDQARGCSV